MWLFILAAEYSCMYRKAYIPHVGFSNNEIPVCQALYEKKYPRIYYFQECYRDNKPRKYVFDFCECRIPVEGEDNYWHQKGYDRAVFCYNTTDKPKPTNTPQATKIIQPALKLPECSHYKKTKTALAVFYQLIFIA